MTKNNTITELTEAAKKIKRSDWKLLKRTAQAMIKALKNPMNYWNTR